MGWCDQSTGLDEEARWISGQVGPQSVLLGIEIGKHLSLTLDPHRSADGSVFVLENVRNSINLKNTWSNLHTLLHSRAIEVHYSVIVRRSLSCISIVLYFA